MDVVYSSPRHRIDRQPPVAESLLSLAPRHFAQRRRERYVADDLGVALAQVAERDQTLLRSIYRKLSTLLWAIADTSTDDARKWRDVADWSNPQELDALFDEVRELGTASFAQGPSDTLAKAMHDVRGGGLSALLGRLQLLSYLPRDESHLKMLFVLVRDHLKIMRSAVTGLDDERRAADRRPKSHDIRLIVDKWHESVVGPRWGKQPVRMSVDCRYEGALTECCLESAAIDRIFYNLANNACRHAASERIEMSIFPIPEPPGECLRFVLSNEVNEEDAAYLRSLIESGGADSVDRGNGQSLFALFAPKVSSTGSGYGLTVVADFVAGAFGLSGSKEALCERYVGAVLEGCTFRVWFHWPMASGDLPPKLDDFHRPAQSLSEP